MKRRGQGGSTTGNGQHERESLRFKRREIGRKRKALLLIVVVMRTRRRNALSTMALVWVCVCVWDNHGSSEALAMEIGGGSTMGFGHGGHGDRWWIYHGFWLWWFSRSVVDWLVKSWICSSFSFSLSPFVCLSLSCCLCVWKCRIF